MTRVLALVPAGLLALSAFWSGGFETSTRFPNGLVGLGVVLALTTLGIRDLPDPLRLGRFGAWWAGALLIAVVASWALSPVPRAGRVAVVLVPAFLILPATVARMWNGRDRRRIGIAGCGVASIAVAAAALHHSALTGWGPAAQPLGHHVLTGTFLAVTLPLAAVGLREKGLAGAVALAAIVTGTVALLATRSLSALVAIGVVALLVALRIGRGRHLVLGLALLALGLMVPRMEAVAGGRDPSWGARIAYLEGAWNGASERWLHGWGPGSTPWLLAGFLRPRPGLNPAGELVGEPHSTPARIAFELGFVGLVVCLGLVAWFFVRRRRELRRAPDRALLVAGLGGLGAGLAAGLGGSWLAVPALPIALALAAGAALAGSAPPPERRAAPGLAAVGLYLTAAAVALAPGARAAAAYDRALAAGDAAGREVELDRAVGLDPEFPLYRARRGWIERRDPAAATDSAVAAAMAARGVAPLWLHAGFLALRSEEPDLAAPALARALALDPLSGGPAFALFVASGLSNVPCAARAMLGEPVLAVALRWRGREELRRRAIRRVADWPGIDAGWRQQFVRQAEAVAPAAGDEGDLVYRIDRTPATSASLHLFRRPAWPAELLRIRIDRAAARLIDVPAAAAMATTSPDAFPRGRCAPEK